MKRTIACIVGARPNLVKMAPILEALRAVQTVDPILVHTGQHYDPAMSDVFFDELGLPQPDVHLRVGSGRQGEQTASILARYEEWLLSTKRPPAATLVVGDVNSTMACALASVKLDIPVIHVEAGLRSFDRRMPEEINRLVTDSISSLLLVSEPSGIENLRREGHPDSQLRLVGNVMIDVLKRHVQRARERDVPKRLGLTERSYALWTMHRPSSVDDSVVLEELANAMLRIAELVPVVFPVHPRTRARLEALSVWNRVSTHTRLVLSPPLGYLDFLGVSSTARMIVTDSGGVQEEASVLGVPCLTLRENTERPITVTDGTSILVGHDVGMLVRLVQQILDGTLRGRQLQFWDGEAAGRVANEVDAFLASR